MTQFYSRVDTAFYGDVYSIPFSYAKKSEINVFINDELYTEWEFLNNSQIKLIEIPSNLPENSIVSIRRTTDISEKVVDYTNQSMLNKDNLNLSQDQLLNAVQEIYDNNEQFEIDTYNVLQQNKEEVLEVQQEFEDEVNFKIKEVSEAASKINALEEAVDTAVTAANTATAKADEAAQQTETLISEGEQILANFTDQGEDLVSELQNEADRITEQIKQLDKNIDAINSKVSIAMFDTILKDHILTYEQSKGWALQGTYVYKEAVAGSRYGYPDFYNKCVEEFESGENSWLKSNVTKVGSLIDKQGVLSGFSNSNYAVLPMTFAPTNNDTWEMVFKTTLSGFGSTFYLIGSGGTSAYNTGVTLSVSSSGYLNLYATSNGSSWNIAGGVSSSIALSTGTYYVKVEFTGSQYVVSVSSDGDSYVNHITVSSTTPVYKATSPNALGHEHGSAAIYQGTIDLNECYINVNGQRFWSGTDTITKHPNGHLFYDIADKGKIDELYNTYGIAWYYGIDKENERIFLPRTKWFIQPTGEITEVNTVNEAGLPNITGNFMAYGYRSGNTGGAFSSRVQTANQLTLGPGEGAFVGFMLNASRSSSVYGNSDTVQPPSINQLLYICVGNTNVESALTDVVEVTTTENDTMPLFTGMYFDFTPNNVSWLKAEEQVNSGGIYTFTYNELVNILNGETKYGDLKVINVADMEVGVDYSEYWKVNQEDMTFITPTAISNKALSGGVMGNGMTLGLTNGATNASLICGNPSYISSSITAYGQNTSTTFTGSSSIQGNLGLTTDPTKSGIIAEQSTSQLYFKVANAVQNLELLDAGEVLEVLSTKTDKLQACEASFPSNKYIDLTLNASGSTYTAPANGWFTVRKACKASGQFISFSTPENRLNVKGIGVGSADVLELFIQVSKGQVLNTDYTASGKISFFRFIYAQGEV